MRTTELEQPDGTISSRSQTLGTGFRWSHLCSLVDVLFDVEFPSVVEVSARKNGPSKHLHRKNFYP